MGNEGKSSKGHVLSEQEAKALLLAVTDYTHDPDRTIGGKERADILAEAALAKGYVDLSKTISGVHSSVMAFQKGKYQELRYLLESSVIGKQIAKEAKNTGLEQAVGDLLRPLKGISEIEGKLSDESIDWVESEKVILEVKAKDFPQDLTMIERIAVAKKDGTQRRI